MIERLLRCSGSSCFLGGLGCGDLGLLGLELDLLLHLASMAEELARRRKFTEAVPNHVLGDQYVYMYPSVVNAERESEHFRRNLGAAGPRLDGSGRSRLLAGDLLEKIFIDIGSLFEASCHEIELKWLRRALGHLNRAV